MRKPCYHLAFFVHIEGSTYLEGSTLFIPVHCIPASDVPRVFPFLSSGLTSPVLCFLCIWVVASSRALYIARPREQPSSGQEAATQSLVCPTVAGQLSLRREHVHIRTGPVANKRGCRL